MFSLQDFQNRVLAAFPQEHIPTLDTLFLPGCWTDGSDGRDAKTCFAGRKWTDLDLNRLGDCSYSLPLLSQESFTYYIAGFLYNFGVIDECYINAWEWHLSPPPFGGYSEQELARRTARLTDEQRGIIGDYFAYREMQMARTIKQHEREYFAEQTEDSEGEPYPGKDPKYGMWVTRYWEQYAITPANPAAQQRKIKQIERSSTQESSHDV